MEKLIFFISAILLCAGFTLPAAYFTDYRDTYTGSYTCRRSCQVLNDDHTGLTIRSATATITIAKDAQDSILIVTIGSNAFKVKLKNSKMTAFPDGRHWAGKFHATDSIAFAISVSMAPSGCTYKGKKN